MRNWIRRLLIVALPALMMMLSASTAEARMAYGSSVYAPAYQQQQSSAPSYGYLYGNQYGSIPGAAQTQASTGVRGYGAQSNQSWGALAQALGGQGAGGIGNCPYCAQGGGGAGSCPWCQQNAASQDGFAGGACPNCPGGNCPWCQQNGQQGGQQFAAYDGAGAGNCPYCVNGNCPYCANGNCNCANGNCNCPWCNQDQAPLGGQQLAQLDQGFGQTRGYQAMQGMPYGI